MQLTGLITAEQRRQRGPLMMAALSAAAAACASVVLLGLSGWFIVGAALAGTGGTVLAFNYLLPSAAIRALAIIRTVGRYGDRLESHRAALQGLARIRPAIFAGLGAQPPEKAFDLSTGEASARMTQDIDAVETLFVRRPGVVGAATAFVAGVMLTGLAGWTCAAALSALFAIQVGGSILLAQGLTRGAGADLQRGAGRLKDVLAAALAAAAELAAYDIACVAIKQAVREGQALDQARARLHRADGWQAALSGVMIGLATVAVIFLAQGASLPVIALASLAAGVTLDSAAVLARGFQQDGAVREAARRVDRCLEAPSVAQLRPVQSANLSFLATGGGWIELQLGERLTFTGPSGCGKTTLVERLMKLRSGEGRRLRIGGVDPQALQTETVRSLFAYAPQDAALLSGTVRENLALAAPEANETEIWAALDDAVIGERVRLMPQGIDTWIGDAGERLSGGERRRLSLARALLRPSPWLVLDEPTEGLDAETEALVIGRLSLRLQRSNQGLLLISHRLAPQTLCAHSLDLDGNTPDTQAASQDTLLSAAWSRPVSRC